MKVNRLNLHDFDQFILKQSKNRTKEIFLTFRFLFISRKQPPKWRKVLGAREKVLVALATVWVAILSPGLDSLGSGFNELRPRNPRPRLSPFNREKMASQNENICCGLNLSLA